MKKIALLSLCMMLCASAWGAVNLNTATQQELESLKGVGPSKARAIIEYRTKHGPFTSIQSLRSVPGFGEKTVKKLEPDLILSGPTQLPAGR